MPRKLMTKCADCEFAELKTEMDFICVGPRSPFNEATLKAVGNPEERREIIKRRFSKIDFAKHWPILVFKNDAGCDYGEKKKETV